MTPESIKLKTINMIRTNNFNKIISSFSLEERLLLSSIFLDGDLNEYLESYKEVLATKLFTHEEAKEYINKVKSPVSNTILFLCLDDKSKIFYLDLLYEWGRYVLFMDAFAESFEDYDCKKECIFYLIKTGKVIADHLTFFLGELDEDDRIEAFDLAYKMSPKSLDNNNIIEVLDSFYDEHVKIDILKKYLSLYRNILISPKNEYEANIKLIDESLFGEVLKLFDTCQKEVLDILIEELINRKKTYDNRDFDVEIFIDFFRAVKPELKMYSLKKLVGNNLLNRTDIGKMTPYIDAELVIPFLELVINSIEGAVVSLELTFIQAISKLKEDLARNAIVKFLINGKKMDVYKVLNFASSEKLRIVIIEEIIKGKRYSHFELMNLLFLITFNNNYKQDSEVILSYFADYYKVDKKRISQMIHKYGYTFLKFMNEKNIIEMLKLPDADLEKFLALFDENSICLNANDINDVSNALIQRQFKFENKEAYQVYSVLTLLLKYEPEETYRQVEKIFNKINTVVPLQPYCKAKGYSYLDNFIDELYSRNDKALEDLHELTTKYLGVLRDRFQTKRQEEMRKEIQVDYMLHRHLYKKYLCKAVSFPSFLSYLKRLSRSLFSDEELALIDNEELIHRIMELKNKGKVLEGTEFDKKFKDSLVLFDKLLDKIYDNASDFDKSVESVSAYLFIRQAVKLYDDEMLHTVFKYDMAHTRGFVISSKTVFDCLDSIREGNDKLTSYLDPLIVKQIYCNFKEYNPVLFRSIMSDVQEIRPKKVSENFLLDIMSRIKIDSFRERVLDNPDEYERIKKELSRYHIIGWGSTFSESMEKADLVFNESTLASFFNYFKEIMEKTGDSGLSVMLDYCNCYDSDSFKYKYLFGKTNYEFLVNNGGKFKAPLSKRIRLEKGVEFVKKMYQRESITIPPLKKTISLGPNKKISCEISCITNMDNLTVGERTDSCLRIGGHFNDLFEFCLLNEDGFHIVFRDPDTGKFISRASGFRNGNTLFINELRDSVYMRKYYNSDLIQALNIFIESIVEESKKSEMPIENVVCSIERAYKTFDEMHQMSPFVIKPDDIYHLHFSSTFEGKVVIIYTNAPQGEKPVFKGYSDGKKVRYPLRRMEPRVYSGSGAYDSAYHMSVLNDVLNDQDIEDIELPHVDGIKMCIVGEDWIIEIYEDGRKECKILSSARDRSIAQSEIDTALESMDIESSRGSR